ncbi:MAG: DUF3445 domain-containing protein, partial [Pseudomonadota bacterium]
ANSPPRYLPFLQGRYDVTPGLYRVGTDFGNGAADQQLFQFDGQFVHYRAAKLAARRENPSKYICTDGLTAEVAHTVNAHLAHQLAAEHPGRFTFGSTANRVRLDCALTGETLHFDGHYKLLTTEPREGVTPPYLHGLDALACQLQEDLAVVAADKDGDQVCAIHLCFPNHWAPQDKIARSFHAIHAPVPGMAPINRKAAQLITAMIHKGPFVRFAWGLATDTRLNHHPVAPPGEDPACWAGRSFDADCPKLYLRVERQTTVGFPEVNAALFTIRSYFYDVAQIRREPAACAPLVSAIESMSGTQLAYKGLARDRDAIVAWLRGGGG